MTIMNETVCRSCGHKLDANTTIKDDTSPKKDDISICVYCGTVSKFDEKLNLVPLTNNELKDIRESDPDCYMEMQKILTSLTQRIAQQ